MSLPPETSKPNYNRRESFNSSQLQAFSPQSRSTAPQPIATSHRKSLKLKKDT
ncbi:MAG: hypothetical protein MUE44_33560 [Oscillatoriaceae cyanobacterium Prado104]|nr:hypothetical protein [Oscillatoriaceae cyanobacterium Prado104]